MFHVKHIISTRSFDYSCDIFQLNQYVAQSFMHLKSEFEIIPSKHLRQQLKRLDACSFILNSRLNLFTDAELGED